MYFIALAILLSCLNVTASEKPSSHIYLLNRTKYPNIMQNVLVGTSKAEFAPDGRVSLAPWYKLVQYAGPERGTSVILADLMQKDKREYSLRDIQLGSEYGERVLWIENDPKHASGLKAHTKSLRDTKSWINEETRNLGFFSFD